MMKAQKRPMIVYIVNKFRFDISAFPTTKVTKLRVYYNINNYWETSSNHETKNSILFFSEAEAVNFLYNRYISTLEDARKQVDYIEKKFYAFKEKYALQIKEMTEGDNKSG